MRMYLTEEEKLLIEEYASMKMTRPCISCDAGPECCGCSKYYNFIDKYKDLTERFNTTFDNPLLKNYVEEYVSAYMNCSHLRKEYDRIKAELITAEKKLEEFTKK